MLIFNGAEGVVGDFKIRLKAKADAPINICNPCR